MIASIQRYKFRSANPKFIVQLANKEQLYRIVEEWKSELFGGSSARYTMKPNLNIGMLKGVPVNISDDQLAADLSTHFDGAKHYRLKSSNGTPLRTVKIEFADSNHLKTACQNGVQLL